TALVSSWRGTRCERHLSADRHRLLACCRGPVPARENPGTPSRLPRSQRCADAQPHGQIGVCDKFAAERDEVAQAFAKPVRCALGVEAVNRRGVPTPIGTLLMHLAVEGSPLGTLIHTLTASRCNRKLADCVRSSPEQSG